MSRRRTEPVAVDAGLWIDTQSHGEGRSGSPQTAESAEIQLEPRIVGEQRLQATDRVGRRNLHWVIAGGTIVLLLECGKEESLVFTNWAAGCEAENVVAEDSLFEAI